MSSSSVLAATTRALLQRAASEGFERGSLLRVAGTADDALEDPRARVPRDRHLAVWEAIVHRCGDFDVGLRFAKDVDVDAFGTLGYLARSSANVGQALAQVSAHYRLVQDAVPTRLIELPGGAVLLEERRALGGSPWLRAVADYALATYVVLLRAWSGATIEPQATLLPYARPASTTLHAWFFGARVLFDQPSAGLLFDAATLRIPLATAQPGLRALLASVASEARSQPGAAPFDARVAEVREAVRARLSTGELGLAVVARALGVSGRSLQRELARSGLAFQWLVDDVRREEALPLVLGSGLLLDEIGARVGYAEPAAFRRAFHRWTGRSARSLRAEQGRRRR